jgi:hypothetical protein
MSKRAAEAPLGAAFFCTHYKDNITNPTTYNYADIPATYPEYIHHSVQLPTFAYGLYAQVDGAK